MGAPFGNQNARKGRWSEALGRAVEEQDPGLRRRKLDIIADKLIEKAQDGDIAAIREIGDRLDGKPHQTIGGPDGEAIPVKATVEFVGTKKLAVP